MNISLVGFEKNVKIEIYSAIGVLVYFQDVNTDKEMYNGKINLRELASGAYIIRASDGQNSVQQKIVKQ